MFMRTSLSYFYQLDCNFNARCSVVCCFCYFLLSCLIRFISTGSTFRVLWNMKTNQRYTESVCVSAKGANEILRLPTHYKVSLINKNYSANEHKTRKNNTSVPKNRAFDDFQHLSLRNEIKLKLKLKWEKINGIKQPSSDKNRFSGQQQFIQGQTIKICNIFHFTDNI